MARHITDRVEVPHWHFPRQWWQILLMAIVVFGVVAGWTILGLFQTVWQSSEAFPPEQPRVVNPPPTETPTPTPTPTTTPVPTITPTPAPVLLLKIEVKWETNGPTESDGIMAVVINDSEGRIIYAVGSIPGDMYPRYAWNSDDGGNSWRFLGLVTNKEINFKDKKEIYKEFNLSAITSLTWEGKKDPNNANVILKPTLLPAPPLTEPEWEFRLSLDGGKSWARINLPPSWKYKGNEMLGEKHHFDLISEEGTLKIFLAAGSKIWYAKVGLP